MPYTGRHILLTFSGALPGGEQWSVGIRTTSGNGAGDTNEVMTTYAQNAANAFRTMCTSTNGWAGGTEVSLCVARSINDAGVTVAIGQGSPTTAPSAAAAGSQANQVAVVVSLLTARAGRTGRGRVYLPLLNFSPGSDGRLNTTFQGNVLSAFVTLVNALNGIVAGSTVRVGVQSQSATPSGAAVTQIRVGRRFDTQRRRAEGLAEAYSTSPVAS